MKKNKLASILFILILAGCNNSSKTIDLKLNLTKGSTYTYSMLMDMNMSQKMMGQEMSMKNAIGFDYVFDVINDSAGWKLIDATISRITVDMDGGGMKVQYDTDKPSQDTAGPMGMMTKMFGAMKGAKFSFTMNNEGKIGEVMGLKEMQQQMTSGLPNEMPEEGMNTFNQENFRQNIEQAFAVYPGKPVKVGDSWSKSMVINNQGMEIKSENTYTLDKVSGDVASIKVVSKLGSADSAQINNAQIKMAGTSNGTMNFNIPSGMIADGNLDMALEMSIKSGEMEMPMKMDMKMKMKGGKK
ncbi:MAG TPA: DUF6263 family protein [Flavisolibacter sp.]|nr:DUF6263 family protein [Flavisolibacter sp.]